jgi:hypothetical protein
LRLSSRPPDWRTRNDNRVGSAQSSESFIKHFGGLDVSLKQTTICIVDEDGKIVGEGKAASEQMIWSGGWRT